MNSCFNPPKNGSKPVSSMPGMPGMPGMGGLPTGNENISEILAMMKKQGVDVSGFEAEAEDIWRSLNDMSERNPEEYRSFIANQMEEMKANIPTTPSASSIPQSMPQMVPGVKQPTSSSTSTAAGAGAGTGKGGKAEEEEKFFRPQAGFCVTTKTTSADGLKIRMEGQGKTLYVNFCHHGE